MFSTCAGAFLVAKRKCAAAYAAYLARRAGLLEVAAPHGLPTLGASPRSLGAASDRKFSGPGSAGLVPGLLAPQERKARDNVEVGEGHLNLVEEPWAEASRRAGTERYASSVSQQGNADSAKLAQAAADGQGASGWQLASDRVDSVCRPTHAPRLASVLGTGPARSAVELPPLSCRRGVHMYCSRSNKQFQVCGAAGTLLGTCRKVRLQLGDNNLPWWRGDAPLARRVLLSASCRV